MKFMTMFGLVGMGGGFLLISPGLRESLSDVITKCQTLMSMHEPYSGLGVGGSLVLALGFYMYRCAQPR